MKRERLEVKAFETPPTLGKTTSIMPMIYISNARLLNRTTFFYYLEIYLLHQKGDSIALAAPTLQSDIM